eukprot:7964193-Lingulodinium_polyedra.AAC.1
MHTIVETASRQHPNSVCAGIRAPFETAFERHPRRPRQRSTSIRRFQTALVRAFVRRTACATAFTRAK